MPVCCNAAHPVAARCNTVIARLSPISTFLVDAPAPLRVGRRSAAVRLEIVALRFARTSHRWCGPHVVLCTRSTTRLRRRRITTPPICACAIGSAWR